MLAFDIISDLHLDHHSSFDWSGQATSPICLVLGDVCRDHEQLRHCLEIIKSQYHTVLYIDGNQEHKDLWPDFRNSYQQIYDICQQCECVFLHDNMVIVNGVAFVGTNGWWTWDFDLSIEPEQMQQWFVDSYKCHPDVYGLITRMAEIDAAYLVNCIKRAQTMLDIKHVVIASHTLPRSDLIEHDLDFQGKYRVNVMGNSIMRDVLKSDRAHKVQTWCFGHYHSQIDQVLDGVRYVNNCRGRPGDSAYQAAYFPRRIEIKI